MKKSLLLLSGAAVVGMTSVAAGQTALTQIFKVDTSTTLAWFTDDHTCRGLGYNAATGNLLAADRDATAGHRVHVLNAATGAEIGTGMDNTGISGGIFPLNKVQATSDGVIYASSLAIVHTTLSNTIFKIYRYANEAAAPSVAFEVQNVTARQGDDVAITGTGNGTKILVSGSGNTSLNIYTTTDGGLTFTPTLVTPSSPGLPTFMPHVTWDAADSTKYWARRAGSASTVTTSTLYSAANTGEREIYADFNHGPIDVQVQDAKTLHAAGPSIIAVGSTNVTAKIHDANGAVDAPALYTAGPLEHGTYAARNNGNAAGDVVIVPGASPKLFVLYTNNSISGWNIPANASVEDWNLF